MQLYVAIKRSIARSYSPHNPNKVVGVMLGCCTAWRAVQWSLITKNVVCLVLCYVHMFDWCSWLAFMASGPVWHVYITTFLRHCLSNHTVAAGARFIKQTVRKQHALRHFTG